ncbi:hypothetical protein [Moraxella bovis]|uniref:hypothetical protein n=1 Tax=Moraxella bovis TaxID=476 RepID=UPI0011C0646D|nr:hypothetical protein [Moraxella bovis]
MKSFIQKLIKTQYCPYCEQVISDKTLIKQPAKFLTVKETKTFCPHCHGQVEKSLSLKHICIALILGLMIAFLQSWLRELQVFDKNVISILGVVLNCLFVFPI